MNKIVAAQNFQSVTGQCTHDFSMNDLGIPHQYVLSFFMNGKFCFLDAYTTLCFQAMDL
jgi:hypothetical protein